jgi:hypothetical protein
MSVTLVAPASCVNGFGERTAPDALKLIRVRSPSQRPRDSSPAHRRTSSHQSQVPADLIHQLLQLTEALDGAQRITDIQLGLPTSDLRTRLTLLSPLQTLSRIF